MNSFPILSDTTYRIESELGSGGGGVVYKAWHSRLQKYVVIKELKRGSANDLETQRNEVEALKNVKSEFLPQVFDFITEGERIFTVIEFIEGDSLDKLLKRKQKFSQQQVIKWYAQLASALKSIHKQNVCHRDIKPANIMLTPNGDVCLIDFNAALVSGNDVNLISRSLGYASPEQYKIYESFKRSYTDSGSSHHTFDDEKTELLEETELLTETEIFNDDEKTEFINDSQTIKLTEQDTDAQRTELIAQSIDRVDWYLSDIYSLGATMYHLLTNKYPSERAEEIAALSKLGRFSEGITYIIEKSMMINSEERFSSADILTDVIANIHELDKRWKNYRIKSTISSIILTGFLIGFVTLTVLGFRRLGYEKIENYNNLVLEIASNDLSYEQAIELFPEKPSAYREQALKLFNSGSYEECIAYIDVVMAKLSAYTHDEADIKSIGNIYYILGNVYFESEEYINALSAYEEAIKINTENPEIYRDYAIALARCGYIDKSEELLNNIHDRGIGEDSITLLRGEIAFAKGNNEDSINFFKEVISSTDDLYIQNRAYLVCDKAYRKTPELINDEIVLLREALQILPTNYSLVLKERLADALVRNKEYDEAIELFEDILQSGNVSYQTRQNIGLLYQQVGEYDNARAVYNELAELYPNDYRPSMRLAFLVLEEQSKNENENRDYMEVIQYYEQAINLCEVDDTEILQLGEFINELQQNGWIE